MAEIKIEDLTTGYVDGTGVFDVLMTAVGSRLEEQYQEDRIKGSDYATAYLGAMQYAMAQAMQYVLGKQQADAQAELLKAQKIAVEEEIDRQERLANSQISLNTKQEAKITQEIAESISRVTRENNLATSQISLNNKQESKLTQDIAESIAKVTRDNNLSTSQIAVNTQNIAESIAKVTRDNSLSTSQINLNNAEIAYKTKQALLMEEEILLKRAQVSLTEAQVDIAEKEILIKAQELLIKGQELQVLTKEVELKTQLILTEQEKVKLLQEQVKELAAKILNETNLADSTIEVNDANILKVGAEKDLLAQKKATEQAQTVTPAGGVIKAQIDLYKRQAEGFDDDKAYKYSKAVLDGWAVSMTADSVYTVKPAYYTDPNDITGIVNWLGQQAILTATPAV